MQLSTRQKLINQAKEHFSTGDGSGGLGGASGQFARKFMAKASVGVNAQNTAHVTVPPIFHYRNCYKQPGKTEYPIHRSERLCRKEWHSEDASGGPRQLLQSNDFKDSADKESYKSKDCFPTCTRKELCEGIIRQLKVISDPNANIIGLYTGDAGDAGNAGSAGSGGSDGSGAVNRNLKTIMDSYDTEYREIFVVSESSVRKDINDMKTVDTNLNRRRSDITENMRVVQQKEKILKTLQKNLEERSQLLLSSKTQVNMREQDRVRIGPAILPFFHVPTRTYVIAALVINVVLLVALVLYAISGGGGGGDGDAAEETTAEEGKDLAAEPWG